MFKRVFTHVLSLLAAVMIGSYFQPFASLGVQAQPGCQTFPETDKQVCGRFLQYWQQNGGLAQQGYPLSGEFVEVSDLNGQPYTVQYFERAVFELHPENKAPYDVLLSQLGTFQFERKYPDGEPTSLPGAPTTNPVPVATSTIAATGGPVPTKLRTLTGHAYYVAALAFSPNGQTLASAGHDGTTRLWRVADGTPLFTLPALANTNWVTGVSFSPDGLTLATTEFEAIRLWRVADGSLLRTIRRGEGDFLWAAVFSPDGLILASGDHKDVSLWNVQDGTILRKLVGNTGGVVKVAFSPNGQTIASGTQPHSMVGDARTLLWRVSDGSLIRTFTGHTDNVYGVAFSPNGQTLASASYDDTTRLWNVSTGALLHTLNGHSREVYYVTFSPDGQTLASGSPNEVLFWRVVDGSLQQKLVEGHPSSIAYSLDGEIFAIGDHEGEISIWQMR